MVVDGDNGILFRFGHRPDGIGNTFLHLGIGSLHGIQFYGMAEFARSHRRDSTATHSDTVIITAQNNNDVTFFRLSFLCILRFGKSDTTGQHDYLIKAIGFITLLMLKCQQTAVDQRLPEFITKIGSPVGGFDQDFFRSMVEPLSGFNTIFPLLAFITSSV